jgi:hypothetical protein
MEWEQGSYQTYYASKYTSYSESIVALVGGVLAFVSSRIVCLEFFIGLIGLGLCLCFGFAFGLDRCSACVGAVVLYGLCKSDGTFSGQDVSTFPQSALISLISSFFLAVTRFAFSRNGNETCR